MTLAESIDEPPPTGTTTVPSSPEADERLAAAQDRRGAGVGLHVRVDADREPGRLDDPADPVDDASTQDAGVA